MNNGSQRKEEGRKDVWTRRKEGSERMRKCTKKQEKKKGRKN